MKILLVYPEFPDTFWSFKHALKFIRKKAGAPPLGLLTVAAMLPVGLGEATGGPQCAPALTDEDLEWADYVFLSAMIVQRESARAVIERCKQAGVKVVAGGPLFTMEHEKFPDVDHFVLNEAEIDAAAVPARPGAGTSATRLCVTRNSPTSTRRPCPLWGLAKLQELRHGQHSVLARLPVQLRLLQRDGAAGSCARAPRPPRRSSPSWTACMPWVGARASSSSTTTSSATRSTSRPRCCRR